MPAKIYIPIFSLSAAAKAFSKNGQNPGCGGTGFTSIRLAFYLAEAEPSWEIFVVNFSGMQFIDAPDNLYQLEGESLDQLFKEYLNKDDPFVVISPLSVLKKASKNFLIQYKSRIIPWIRHPFSADLNFIKIGFPAYVCVGNYQYESLKYYYKYLWHIQNIFVAPGGKFHLKKFPEGTAKDPLRLVSLGALVPGKGYLEIARQWSAIKKSYPSAELHVIGAAETYGAKSENKYVPAERKFAAEILRYIPEKDLLNNKVVFYGNLGEEKFEIISKCHIALLNPTGKTEAFPSSPLECMAAGVPVIASADYGMSDSMRFFSELSLKNPGQIVDKIKYLEKRPGVYAEMQKRSIAVAGWFELQHEIILIRWLNLIKLILCDQFENIGSAAPYMPFYGSRFKLIYRVGLNYLKAVKGLSTKW